MSNANAFDLFGTLNLESRAFENSLKVSDARLIETQKELTKTEQASVKLGDTSATVGRRYEKLNEQIGYQRQRLLDNALAFEKGEINARKFSSVLSSVERATSSLNSRIKDANARVKEIGDTGFTHFQNQIKGATSELSNFAALLSGNRLSGATSQITSLGNIVAGITPEAEAASTSLGAIAIPAGIAGAAIVGTGVAAYQAGKFLLGLAENAVKLADPLIKTQEVTGLSGETITALSYAAKIAGTNIDALQRPLNFFVRQLAEAEAGSDKARAALAKVGVKSDFGNLQESLNKALETIRQTPDGVAQMDAAFAAFGPRGGSQLISVVKNMGESLNDFEAKAKAAGLTLSTEDLRSIDAFGDALDKVKLQGEVLAAKFATGYMPTITRSLDSLGAAIGRNEDRFTTAGTRIGNVLTAVLGGLGNIASFVDAHPYLIRLVAGAATYGISEATYQGLSAVGSIGEQQQKALAGKATEAVGAGNNAPDLEDETSEKLKKSKEDVAKAIAEITRKSADDQITQELEIRKAQIATGDNAVLAIRQTTAAEEFAAERRIALIRKTADDQINALTDEEKASGKEQELRLKADQDAAAVSTKLIGEQIKSRQAEQAEIQKTITKINELEKTALSALAGLAGKSVADNPIASVMLKGSEAIEKLKTDLKGLPAAFVAVQVAAQQKLNLGEVFGAQIDASLNAINLRSQAAKFRGPTDAELAARGLSQNQISGFRNQQGRDQVDSALRAVAGARSEDEQARADRALTNFANSFNPDSLRKDQREAIAAAFDRQADRQDKFFTDAPGLLKEISANTAFVKNFYDNKKTDAKSGTKVDIFLKDDTSDKKSTNATVATEGDVAQTYDVGFFNGRNN